jgi:very-short-patch-repair endonuclease
VDVGMVNRLADAVDVLGIGNRLVGEVEVLLVELEKNRREWRMAEQAADALAALFNLPTVTARGELQLLLDAVTLVESTPRAVLLRRRPSLDDEDVESALAQAEQAAIALRSERERLLRQFDLPGSLVPEPLRGAAQVMFQAGWIARFRARYRHARALWRGLIRQPSRAKPQTMAGDLVRIANYLDGARAFASNPRLATLLGESFQGIPTDFQALLQAARFFTKTRSLADRRMLSRGEITIETQARRVLAEADIAALDGMRSFAASEGRGRLQRALELMAQRGIEDLGAVTTELDARVEAGRQLAAGLHDLGIRPDILFVRLREVASSLAELKGVETELDRLTGAREIVRTAGLDPVGDSASIEATLDYAAQFGEDILSDMKPGFLLSAEEVQRKKVVQKGLRAHFFHEDIDIRLTESEALRQTLSRELAAALEASEAVGRVAGSSASLLTHLSVEDLERQLAVAVEAPEALEEWSSYLRLRAEVVEAGAAVVLEAYGDDVPEGLPEAYARAFWWTLARLVFAQHPELSRLAGTTLAGTRQRFQEADRRLLELNAREIASKLCRRSIPPGSGRGPRSEWTDLALIRAQTQLERPRIAIRDLVRRAGAAIQAMKPCWMMSPISVAQFIEPGSMEFDVVVIDEASQMRPEEAIGATARGRQVVVVGDPLQLPPTSFFDRMDGFDDEDQEELEEESILDLALGQFQPFRHLRWHYRSRHERLIRFSNRHFYADKLIVFPSPSDHGGDLGVWYRPVNGVYRGRGGNPDEVKAVAMAAIEAMQRHPDWSLGVVTVNLPQAELLRMEIDRLLLRNEAAQEYVARWEETLEPFFVKNLENVQGDERDMMIISTVYGPSEAGHVLQRFGPINQRTGHRRLNVLFTRAKCRVELYTSLTAAQVREEEGSSSGVKALKAYLEYAATGRLESGSISGREPESDFEIEVAEALRAKGFEVVAQVGVEGYYLDLAVKHPEHPHGFLAGIECDGASYHSSRSAKDRDILRQQVLESLGWRLYRVWSTDWFSNRKREIDRLLQFLAACLERQREGGLETRECHIRHTDGDGRDAAIASAPSERVVSPGPRRSDGSPAIPKDVSTRWGSLTGVIARALPAESWRCAKCGGQATIRVVRTAPVVKCSKTECGAEFFIAKETLTQGLKAAEVRCGTCGADVTAVRWRLGEFVGCSTFPQCRWSRSWSDLYAQLRR